jgi:hypothetical protein
MLIDKSREPQLKDLLKFYSDPTLQEKVLYVLQRVYHHDQFAKGIAKEVNKHRKWFKRRDRWCKRISWLWDDTQHQRSAGNLYPILTSFRDSSLYGCLRSGDRLTENYHRELDHVIECIKQLQAAVAGSSILSGKFTTSRGGQPQPYKHEGVVALRRLGLRPLHIEEFFILLGVKVDPESRQR